MGLRRFAPVWIVYTILLLLAVLTYFSSAGTELYSIMVCVRNIPNLVSLLNFAYCFALAQLLFGDLYTPRLCYAIHSLPVTKGGWFGTQIILGTLGSIVPIFLAAGVTAVMLPAFQNTAAWILGAILVQFAFFFGVAVLCAILAGNRLGMALLYVIANFWYIVILFIEHKLIAPLMYGIRLPKDLNFLCPLLTMINSSIMWFDTSYIQKGTAENPYWEEKIDAVHFDGNLGIMAAYACIGIAAIWLAMRLYRKRKLECAGDFLAFPQMEGIILILTTVGAGVCAHFVASDMMGNPGMLSYLFLAVGLVAGYFACLMLLKRQINVFRPKAFGQLAIICLAFALVLTAFGLDVFGITHRVPDASQIESAILDPFYHDTIPLKTTDPKEIEMILQIHQDALERHRSVEKARPLLERIFGNEAQFPQYPGSHEQGPYMLHSVEYTMKDGSHLERCYYISGDSECLPMLNELFSKPEIVFSGRGVTLLDEDGGYETLLENTTLMQLRCYHNLGDYDPEKVFNFSSAEDMRSLMDAIYADCEAGHMAQGYFLHQGECRDYLVIYYELISQFNPNFSHTLPYYNARSTSMEISLYDSCTNTLQWLNEHCEHTID